jgi:hypothetical protein
VTKKEAKMMADELRIYLRADGDIAKRFEQIKAHLGLKNDTEVMRSLINWYWKEHQEELQPALEHFNVTENGVRILDRTIGTKTSRGRIIDVYFKPDKAWCEYCESSSCQHVQFALSLPEVQETLRKKGWKILE